MTLIVNIEFVEDMEVQESIWSEQHRSFFTRGIDDPKFRLLKFHMIEATLFAKEWRYLLFFYCSSCIL